MNSNFNLTNKEARNTYQNLVQYDKSDGSKYNGIGEKISFYLSGGMDLSNPYVWGDDITAPTFLNVSFESPNIGNSVFFQYTNLSPVPNWTFGGSSGIAGNNSPFNNGIAPFGDQVVFLQGLNSYIEQTLNFTTSGYYVITFWSAQRGSVNSVGQVIGIYVDGVLKYKIKPNNSVSNFSSNYIKYSTNDIYIPSGNHTIRFNGETGTGDNTAFIDYVDIKPSYKYYTNFIDKKNGQGKYILSNLPYENFGPNGVNPDINVGVEISNPDNKMVTYLGNLNFTGRFLDSNVSPSQTVFNIKPTFSGSYASTLSPSIYPSDYSLLNIWCDSCLTNNNNSPYDTLDDFPRSAVGSLTFMYKSNTTWYLDFLMTIKNNWTNGYSRAWRFESLSWSVISV